MHEKATDKSLVKNRNVRLYENFLVNIPHAILRNFHDIFFNPHELFLKTTVRV